MKTTVVNISHVGNAFDVYIGRRSQYARLVRCRKASPFANPFKVGPWAGYVKTREEAVALFEKDLRMRLDLEPGLRAQLLALDGLVLGCWCAPQACHGDVLVKLIEELKGAPKA